MRIVVGLFAALVMNTAFAAPTAKTTDTAKMNKFINNLMSKMTLEEKAGQLTQYSADMSKTGNTVRENYREDIIAGRVGSLLNAFTPKFTRELQQVAVEKTRLKIPLLFGYDVIHGHRTIFPIPLGEAASWDMKRIEDAAAVAAKEASADGIHWTFAPMVDISRDPRWGRIMEGAGEDVWLGSKIAAARVRGFQGDKPGATDRVLACVKHFAVYGAPVAGRDYNPVDMSDRELWESYLPVYKAAIDAGAATAMTSFNDINGVPATANDWLLNDVLRKQWKFKGFVVTDYTAIYELIPHGVAKDLKDAALQSFRAGSEMDMMSGAYPKYLPQLVKEGKISKAQLDTSVRRVLEAKYKLGLFDDPYRFSDEKRAEKAMLTPENRAVARDVARRSLVLLKNDNGALPLKREGTIAVIGPMADNQRDLIGAWSAAGSAMDEWKKAITVIDGLKQVGGSKVKVLHAKGSEFFYDEAMLKVQNEHGANLTKDKRSREEMINEAVRTAKKADVVVMAIGESHGLSGEAASRTSIRVPEPQQELLKAVRATGKPVITLIFSGRPLALEAEAAQSDAMLAVWFPGTESGNAIADVLFGDHSPSGKLPVTFPRNEGQIPIYYSHKNTGRPYDGKDKYRSQYLDVANTPLYAFGHGLSYGKFDYSDLKLSSAKIKPTQKLKVSVTITNNGEHDGEETAQLYVRDMVASVTRPVKQLRGFQKVFLKKGESKQVTFEVALEDLKFYDKNMKWVAEPGDFKVFVGTSSDNVKEAGFTLL
ncbi:MAG: beta-glucosidase BglX [Bdellovibrionales bacterium]|nr:beta-glucosidase BglX [Bdellovibrionales bacterium]